jgi:hypothetical protein
VYTLLLENVSLLQVLANDKAGRENTAQESNNLFDENVKCRIFHLNI